MADKPTDKWTFDVQGLGPPPELEEVPDTDIVPIPPEAEAAPSPSLAVPVPPPPDLDATVNELSVAPPSVPRPGFGEDTLPEALLHADTSPSILIPPEVNLPPREPAPPTSAPAPHAAPQPTPQPTSQFAAEPAAGSPTLPAVPSLSVADISTDPSLPTADSILPAGNLLTDTNPSLPPAAAVTKFLAQKAKPAPAPMQEADTRPMGLKAEVEANLRGLAGPQPTPNAPQPPVPAPAPAPSHMPKVSSGESTLSMGEPPNSLDRTLQDTALPKAPLPRAAQEEAAKWKAPSKPTHPVQLKAWESAPTTVDPVPAGSMASPHTLASPAQAPQVPQAVVQARDPQPTAAPEPLADSPTGTINIPQSIEKAESELDISDPAVSLAKRFRINPFESETNPSLLTGDNVFTEIAKHAHSAAQAAAEIFETSSAAYFSSPTPPADAAPMSVGLSASSAATSPNQFQPQPASVTMTQGQAAAQTEAELEPEPRPEKTPEAQALGLALTQTQPGLPPIQKLTQPSQPSAPTGGLEISNPEWLADLATPIPQPPMFGAQQGAMKISSGSSLLRPAGPPPAQAQSPAATPAPEPTPEDPLPEVPTPRDIALNSDTVLSVRTPVQQAPAQPVAVPASAGTPAEEFVDTGGDTLMLDREQQDKLMELRAQQDELLREQMGENVVVMFTDLVGSTAYYEKFGDLMGRQKMLSHNALLFPIVRAFDGTVIKTIGDSIMACFPSSLKGLDAAEQMQQALHSFNDNCETAEEQIHIRIGLNAGPAIAEDGDLHGDAVNVASRVQSRAASDEVLVAESMVFEAPDRVFDLLGPVSFKGKAEPIKVYRFRWKGDGEQSAEGPSTLGGRYALGEIIGRGPMAVVYAADDERLDIKVAVKVFHGFLAKDISGDQDFVARVRTMAKLQHPNILRTLDFSSTDVESPYYVTEYLESLDLAAYVARNGQPSLGEAVQITLDIADAVAFGHSEGALHTNLKPQNVLITPARLIKVADFGMAQIRATQVTNSGNPLGPPAYQAPEQVVGGGVDERTDVYSVGAVLYFLLAGRPPYEGSATFHALRAVASGLYKPLNRVRPDLPAELVEVCNRAMGHKKESRFSSVADLIAALRPFAGAARGAVATAVPVATPAAVVQQGGPQWQSSPPTEVEQPLTSSGESTIKMEPYAPAEGTDPAQVGITEEELRGRRPSRKIAPVPTPKGADHRPAIALGVAAMLVVAVALGYGMRLRAKRSAPPVPAVAGMQGVQGTQVVDLAAENPNDVAPPTQDPVLDAAVPTAQGADGTEPAIPSPDAIPPSAESANAGKPTKGKQTKSKSKLTKRSVPVKISVKPWADVTINGTFMGRAKASMEVELPPGKHSIKLLGPKRRSFSGDFVVVAGKPNIKKFKLPLRPGPTR